MRKISSYLDLVRRRANGSLKTAATWIRDFVRCQPSYKFDSVVNKEINYDLVVAVDEMSVFSVFTRRKSCLTTLAFIVSGVSVASPTSCPKIIRAAEKTVPLDAIDYHVSHLDLYQPAEFSWGFMSMSWTRSIPKLAAFPIITSRTVGPGLSAPRVFEIWTSTVACSTNDNAKK